MFPCCREELESGITAEAHMGCRYTSYKEAVMPERRPPAQTFEDLYVWEKAHEFVLAVYRMTEGFPKTELFGLTAQLRRAAVSIAANIAEGFKKRGRADKLRFLNIAQGSLEECRYYLRLCQDLQYADPTAARGILNETSILLEAYYTTIARPSVPTMLLMLLGMRLPY
jgi:four helix bundle protein